MLFIYSNHYNKLRYLLYIFYYGLGKLYIFRILSVQLVIQIGNIGTIN